MRVLIPLLTLLLCGCPKLWGPCPGGVLNTFSLRDGEMTMTDDSGSDVNWGDVENLNLEKCTEVQGSIFLQGEVRGLQKFSSVKNITGTIWFFGVRVDPPGLVELFPALEVLGGIDATEANSQMEVFSGFRALQKSGDLVLGGLGAGRVDGFELLASAGNINISALSLPAFGRLRTCGDLTIRLGTNVQLEFSALESAGNVKMEGLGTLTVSAPRLVSLGSLDLDRMENLESLAAPELSTTAALLLTNCARLSRLELASLENVGRDLYVNRTALSDFSGLLAVTHVGGDVRFMGNSLLTEEAINAWLSSVVVEGDTTVCENRGMPGGTGCPPRQ